jgi:hypothetical protein
LPEALAMYRFSDCWSIHFLATGGVNDPLGVDFKRGGVELFQLLRDALDLLQGKS